ncbi:PEP-CTERM sorting domain-containing protein [Geomonas paludis]|uniref:PEP-CTERM sorting domain-containing protein n=1 Tax=Geomonas paludis TaxID=2740185 RepID=A0ABY4LIN9_9BACT|nr:PEP-CTERM sorting domain-containing protein [Geomonas paludis]UPU37861.1 PEP-CTERM sorting domain-containing protein [Geomonas paludis]
MLRPNKTLSVIAFGTVLLSSSLALSATLTYTDHGAWMAALGGGITTIDFNGMGQGSAWWLSSATTVGDTSFSSDGGDLWAVDPTFPGGASYFPTDYLLWNPALNDDGELVGRSLTIGFGGPVGAVGWDFGTLDGGTSQFTFLMGDASFTATSSPGAAAFFGVISDTPLGDVTMVASGFDLDHEGAMGTIDNLSFAPASPASPVPEPSTVLLCALGLAGMAIVRKPS